MDKIYTPTQIWANYNAQLLPLEVSIIDIITHKNSKYKAIVKNLNFTSEITQNGQKVRAYMKLYYKDSEEIAKLPTFLIFQDYENNIAEDVILESIAAGYMVAVFDYKGEINGNKKNCTLYPEELSYCNFNVNNKELYIADPNIFNTALFHYTIIARRAIALLKDEPMCDYNNIAAIGLMNGCDIAWPTIAFDENIKTGIFISNLGFKTPTDCSKTIIENNKSAYEAFQIGCSAETYSKLNKKPILSIIGTNNSITPIEKVTQALNIANENDSVTLLISSGDNYYIDKEVNKTIQFWLKNFLSDSKNKKIYKSPEITSEKIDENNILINAKIESEEDVVSSKISISTIDSFAETRNWYEFDFDMKSKTSKLNLIQGYGTRYCFLTIEYKNGLSISSKPIKIITENINNEPLKKQRIIYDSKIDKNIFKAKSPSFFSETSSLINKKGPNNIYGIGTLDEKSILLTYAIGDLFKAAEENYSLRFYAYTPEDKEVTIIVKVLMENKITEYSTKINIYATGDWNAFIIDSQDLKDNFLKPLKTWEQVKILSFKNAENVLFNNFIWV